MKTLFSERSNWFLMVLVVALTVVLCAAVNQALAGPPDAPSAARRTVAWNTAGITVDTNSSANLSQAYAYHDLFCSVDMHTTGAVTITVQASPAGTTYYDVYIFAQPEADTDVFTRVLSYGRYERLEFDVQGSNLLTPTCTSIFFNDWYPSGYARN